MSLFSSRIKSIAVFVYILLFLLALNLYFNLNFSWEGITLIVRIYIYIFSFYLVFTFSSINIDLFENMYRERFGPPGEQILFLEARVAPLLLLYCIVIVFTLIAGVNRPEWPWLRSSSAQRAILKPRGLFPFSAVHPQAAQRPLCDDTAFSGYVHCVLLS
jgi:hypothetical protein